MHRLTVLYGHPTNPDEFDRYYHEVHIPIAKKNEGSQRLDYREMPTSQTWHRISLLHDRRAPHRNGRSDASDPG